MIKNINEYNKQTKEKLRIQNELRKLKYLNSYNNKQTTTTINQPIEKKTNKGYKIFDRNINLLEQQTKNRGQQKNTIAKAKEGKQKAKYNKQQQTNEIERINSLFIATTK